MSADALRVVYDVPTVSCEHCKRAIEGAVKGLTGVDDVTVDVGSKTVRVSFRSAELSPDRIKRTIEAEGYAVASEHPA